MKIDKKSFEGKTIASVDTDAVNVLNFEFTDGTSVLLETEHVGHGIYGFGQYKKEDFQPAK